MWDEPQTGLEAGMIVIPYKYFGSIDTYLCRHYHELVEGGIKDEAYYIDGDNLAYMLGYVYDDYVGIT
jgi:hypothetical protein